MPAKLSERCVKIQCFEIVSKKYHVIVKMKQLYAHG